MNRARLYNVVLHALLYALLLPVASSMVSAQANRARSPHGSPVLTGLTRSVAPQRFAAVNQTRITKDITKRHYRHSVPAQAGRVAGDNPVIRQTVLITKSDPTVPFSTATAPSQDAHPFATADEKYLYFDSDRVDATTIPEVSSGHFNIFRMFLDGSGVTQITTGADNKIEPAVSQDGSRVAYVSGGSISNIAANLDNPPTSGFNLYYIDLSTGGNPVSLTLNNSSHISFIDVRHPTWSSAGDKIAFAGRTSADPQRYHIFIVTIQAATITQFTGGVSNDYAPAWSPDGSLVAFTSNATGFTQSTVGIAAAGLAGNDDIWVLNPNPVVTRPTRVTNFSAGGKQSSNKNPSWSTLRLDPLAIVPVDTNGGTVSHGASLLAFASNRADSQHDGNADSVVNTFDIYWMRATISPDAQRVGVYVVSTPETGIAGGNTALKLRTSTPNTAIDVTDPASMFDPNFATNEDYPTWPQYISSYRIYYQSDRSMSAPVPGPDLNIWGSTIFDINAPTLLKYDINNNEIVHVGREVPGDNGASAAISVRQVNAGDTVRLKARVVDYESGVQSVYAQIKNPNSAPQSADGKEHKIYFRSDSTFDPNIVVQDTPNELDAQAINLETNTFRQLGATNATTGQPPIPAAWPGWNMYIAGRDDTGAFTGGSQPPDDHAHDYTGEGAFWLQLWDDGPISQGGHEPEGEVKGDGVFTNTWQSPIDLPSDWYLDIIARDNAVDPFFPTETTNWKIYDNVWGFTSAPFQGKGQFLYINDYDIGQRFFQGRFGSSFTGGSGFNQSYTGVPTESWMTEIDPALLPTKWINPTSGVISDVHNVLTPLGQLSYGSGNEGADPTVKDNGNPIPITGSYDQWRILARGPIPDSVLNAYRAHIEQQPADVIAGGTAPRQVTVAERAVIWHAPYVGDLFIGPGTIADSDTQIRLQSFVASGGRLFVNGEDVAFGLTLGQTGATANTFLNQTLHVTYTGDNGLVGGPPPITYVAGKGVHPIATDSYYTGDHVHNYPTDVIPGRDWPSDAGLRLGGWAAQNAGSDDAVMFNAATRAPDVAEVDATYTGGSDAIMWFTDRSHAPLVSKVVFSPFGWEQIHPEYYFSPNTTIMVFKNRRVELIHNLGDHLRTGRIVGNVRDVNGGGPVGRVFLRAITQDPNVPAPRVAATTYTQSDGSYVLNGLDANSDYSIDVVKAGFVGQHAVGGRFHGGWQTRVDLFLVQAQPGNITGKVTLATSGAPAPGVIVVAQSKSDPTAAPFTGVTDVNGVYVIKNVPPDPLGYIVTVPLTAPGNAASLGYGASNPTSYGGPEAGAKPAVIVMTGQTASGIDFTLKQAPGSISGTVTDATTNLPISGAAVTATNGSGTFTGTTAADGTYTLPAVDPGTYIVTATAAGYASNSAPSIIVTTNQATTGVNIALTPIPPGSLSGLVTSATNVPVGGATVTVYRVGVNGALGAVIATTTTGAVQTVTNSDGTTYTYNYRFASNLPAGAKVIVDAEKSGYTDKTPNQTVGPINSDPPGPEIKGVNFILDALHTFPSTLTLISAPYEYTTPITTLFNIPSADVANKNFVFIYWDTAKSQYVYNPTPPADTFHLGLGYFVQEINTFTALSITQAGTPAPQNADGTYKPFSIPLKTGWNLIGDPFPFSLDFLTLQVQDQDGSLKDVLTAQSGASPALGSALWTYENGNYAVVFTLDAYRGYWIRAFRPVTLIVTPASNQGRASSSVKSLMAGNAQGSGWKLTLQAAAGTTRSAPGIIGVHPAATDNYDQFKLEAPPAVGPQNVSLTFDHQDWAAKAGQYSVDVRSVASTQQKWSLTLNSNVSGSPVTLTWPTLATIPGKYDVLLTDEDTHQTMNLRRTGNYVIPATRSTGPLTRHLTLQVSRATRQTLTVTGLTAMVTRSAGRSATSADIHYAISAPASVKVSIRSSSGRVIRNLDQGNTRAAGANQVVWDLRTDAGEPVAANAYTVEVVAESADGQVLRQETPLLITR